MRSSMVVESKSKSSSRGSNNEEAEDNDHVGDNSCYYPGCKKNVSCKCEICLDSINATLDLIPLTKLSASKPIHRNLHCTPISFNPSLLNTPTSTPSHVTPHNNAKKRSSFYGLNFFSLLLALGFLLSADIAFPWVVSRIYQPALSPDVVKRIADKCWHVHDWNAKLRSFQKDLMGIAADGKNCTYSAPTCEIIQDGLLLNSRCTLYKSAIEEVTIWGWPLQTAGLLTNGFSFRSLTILSGRVTEWNAGQVGYLIRKANSSWVQSKLGASVVQLDPNTWVLEYQRSSIFNSTRLYASLIQFLKYRTSRIVSRLKKCFWRFAAAFEDKQLKRSTTNNGDKIPT
ncbi:hypothetical protein Lal_00046971 [Lupinus albus]|uniref:Uncharacterized protein n=1 Tax=Lupinus albus TaxID=3870 RepID=A0A6A4QWL6_LUPAL|nr:hypothetical protein Lalb_Chr02g0140631 [Lupinus albus]KAF1878304.1 hypothetical protein Lal_00046971 [Lupinus albus]